VSPVYLDHNATTPVRPEAAAAVAAALAVGGNPSSVHGAGRAARRTVERARENVAALVGARPEEIVFTSGGTEANHLALLGTGRRLVVSAIEHDSVLRVNNAVMAGLDPAIHVGRSAHSLARGVDGRVKPGHDDRVAPVRSDGIVDLDALERLIEPGALVSVMLANNETGVVQPVGEVARIAQAKGALLHCDAVQAVGKIPVDVAALGADLVTLSAHKLGGPQGVGALVARTEIASLLRGGGQERGRRAGTENVPGIAGFGAAAAAIDLGDGPRMAALRDALEAELSGEAVFFGREAARLPNTSCLATPGVKAETQVIALDLDGVMVSAGAACSSGKVRASHVLGAMGVAPELAGSAIRVSLGWTSTESDVDRFIAAWRRLLHRRRAA
jgi:cysteine desulfurase